MPRCPGHFGYFRVVTGTIHVNKFQFNKGVDSNLQYVLLNCIFCNIYAQPLILYGFDCCLGAGCYCMVFLKMALDLYGVEVSLSNSEPPGWPGITR